MQAGRAGGGEAWASPRGSQVSGLIRQGGAVAFQFGVETDDVRLLPRARSPSQRCGWCTLLTPYPSASRVEYRAVSTGLLGRPA